MNNDFNEYREDKILKHTPINDCRSDCCNAPTNSDTMICSECQEHCDEFVDQVIKEKTERLELDNKIMSKQMKWSHIHDIHTFYCSDDNEVMLSGKNENGDDITLVFNAFELLSWIDIKYIKKQTIKHIRKL